jgi:hypothetical protein
VKSRLEAGKERCEPRRSFGWSRHYFWGLAVVFRTIRRVVFAGLRRISFHRRVMSDGETLRARGFRPIDPGDKREVFASRAEAYGYEVVHTAEAVWIRKMFRRSGQQAPLAIRKGPRWDARTPWDSASSKFFDDYAATKYAEGQRGLSANYPEYSLSPFTSTDPELYRAFDRLVRIVSRSSPERLPGILQNEVLPALLAVDPEAAVQVFSLDVSIDRAFGFLRGGYAVLPEFNWSSQLHLFDPIVGPRRAPRPVFASRGSFAAWC